MRRSGKLCSTCKANFMIEVHRDDCWNMDYQMTLFLQSSHHSQHRPMPGDAATARVLPAGQWRIFNISSTD
jgi:hypothetical protein